MRLDIEIKLNFKNSNYFLKMKRVKIKFPCTFNLHRTFNNERHLPYTNYFHMKPKS